jgi:uncharacterized protein YlaI
MEEVRRKGLHSLNRFRMMRDDYAGSNQEEHTPNLGRWVVLIVALAVAALGFYGILLYMPLDMIPLYMFMYLPLVIFLLYATLRWAQGRSIAATDIAEDDRILETMRKHALPVEYESLGQTYRCPNCHHTFDISNARPVDTDVFLCPFCDSRLYIK